MLTYSWWRGEASRRALAQSCAWRGAAARGRSRAAARSLRARGLVIGRVIGRVSLMGRSLVRRVWRGQDGGADFCRAIRVREDFYTAGMTTFHVRVATAEDVAEIRKLIDASVRGLQAGDYSAAQIEGALETVFTVDSQLIVDGTYFVAFAEDGELAGCGGWSFRKTLYGGDHQIEKIASERLDALVDAAKIRAIFV